MPDRFLDLTTGVAMVVTDLHGDRDAFNRYVNCFHTLYQSGDAQRLIFLGDLTHGYGPPQTDASLNMILDVIALQRELGEDRVIMLLGNHEMPHIYGIALSKGEIEFTPRFERMLGDHREQVLTFFDRLPFVIRTAAGVMLTHAGPEYTAIDQVDLLRTFDHQAVLRDAEMVMAQADDLTALYRQYSAVYGAPYEEDAEHYLAVKGRDDPRYPHLLRAFIVSRQSQAFQRLWDMLCTQNEAGLTEYAYVQTCKQFLAAFSVDAPVPQRVIVSGHMITPMGGYALVNRFHLRMSSATHARPREAGRYLLLDCAKPVGGANELLGSLGSVFEDEQ
jgi:hypothetical protein